MRPGEPLHCLFSAVKVRRFSDCSATHEQAHTGIRREFLAFRASSRAGTKREELNWTLPGRVATRAGVHQPGIFPGTTSSPAQLEVC